MTDRIIEITPELERRILQERRREPREKIAALERRLARIAELIETNHWLMEAGRQAGESYLDYPGDIAEILRLAKGEPKT
jgi:prephenate dehydrogenase